MRTHWPPRPSRRLRRPLLALAATPVVALALAAGCQTAQGGFDPPPRANVEGGSERCVVRFVDGDEKAELSSAEKKFEFTAGTRRTLFLNRYGGTYVPGSNNSSTNRSSIASSTAKIPAYAKGDARWSKLVSCVRGQFARWNLEVTDKDPKDAVHIEAVVGGLAGNLGLSAGIGGIAPMTGDCDNPVVERAVVFVFSQAFADDQEECQVVAHEAGHALGLDHEYLCADPMTYLRDCGAKSFQDKAASCGTYAPQSCTCGSKQNSVKHLDTVLGPASAPEPPPPPVTDGGAPPPPVTDGGAPPPPVDAGPDAAPPTGDTTGPTIALLSPADGTILPEFSTVVVSAKIEDPSGVGKAVLRWSIGGKTTEIDCASPFFEVSCVVSGGTYTWKIPAGKGARTWAIAAVDGKGNASTSAARGLSLGDSTPPPPPPPPDDGGAPPPPDDGGAPPPPAKDGGAPPPPASDGGAPPPPVSGAPVVSFAEPAEGTSFSPGASIPVRVDAKATSGAIAKVQLVWRSPTGDTAYTLELVSSGRYGIDLDLSPSAASGARTLTVTVTDDAGRATKVTRTLTVGP